MKNLLFAFTLSVVCLVSASFAQERSAENLFEFKGVVKAKDAAVFAGTPLFFNNNGKETSVSTDINGEFSVKLAPGNYEVTVRKTLSETFKAFIFIQENGLNPQNVEFVVEPNAVCCGAAAEKPYPKITKLAKPPYPAAARAVRASGVVVVEVKIDRHGKVIEASAVSGHPLLRAASAQAAKQSLFEPSESDEIREAKLTFVFFSPQTEKENIRRYSNSYRVEVFSTYEIILNTIDTKTS
jgi:TonB family protein